jgi:glycosyltransferase involved in cell wall biosynthesis
MDIGIDGRTFSVTNPGGAVKVALKFTNQLSPYFDSTTVFSSKSAKNKISGTRVISNGFRFENNMYKLFWEQVLLPRYGEKENIDYLLCPNTYCPLRSTSYDIGIIIPDFPALYGYVTGPYAQFRKFMLPRVTSRADSIIVPSKFLKKETVNRLGVKEKKVKVVPNGIDQKYLKQDLPENPQIDLPDKYILFVGTMSERKNISGIVRSWKIAKEQMDIPHDLVLVGSMNKSSVDSVNIRDIGGVHVLGYLSDEMLRHCYHTADIFLFPSLHESFGIPPLEAMAMGTPVITSNRTASAEIAGPAAHLVDPTDNREIADGIKKIHMNPDYKQSLIEKGLTLVQQYTWESAAKSMSEVIKSEK